MSAQTTALPGGVAPRRLAAMSNGGVTSYAWLPGVAFITAFITVFSFLPLGSGSDESGIHDRQTTLVLGRPPS